jgi:acetyl-CoA carboxylase carboxyl transferase subunit alpha
VTKRERLRERIRRSRALAAERKENKRREREGTFTTISISKEPEAQRPSDTLGEASLSMSSDARNLEKQRQRAIDSLERDVEELSRLSTPSDENAVELERIREEVGELKREFYTHLGPWQRLLIARHPQRPYTDDFIRLLFENFTEIHGDRGYGDDAALITGMAWFHGKAVMIVGSQKGRDTKQRLVRNFGQAKPEGYRKSLRAMELAAKFRRPIFVFVDTPGAYPGVGAEERGQAEAIAYNLREMSRLPVPIIVTITGEGGSGGALAVAVGDRVFMLENSVYSVISPEGCASIMWRDSSKAETAAEALKITAKDLLAMKLIDEIVPEPEGGAHFDHEATARLLEPYLERSLLDLGAIPPEQLVEQRYQKFRHIGQFFA